MLSFRVAVCEELLRPCAVGLEKASETPGHSALQALFQYVGFRLPDDVLEMLGFFYIKCLLHAPFKQTFTRCFVRSYGDMIDTMTLPGLPPGEAPPVSKFLDLLSCQLFHNVDHVTQLVEEERLLHHLLSKLHSYMKQASDLEELVVPHVPQPLQWDSELGEGRDGNSAHVTAPVVATDAAFAADTEGASGSATTASVSCDDSTVHIINCEERRINEQLFMRLCADLRSIITHERVARQIIEDPCLLQLLTCVVAALQTANPHTRQLGRHVEYESRGWQYAFILEFEVTGVLKPILRAFGEAGAPRRLSRAVLLRCAELLLQWRASATASCLAARDSGSDELVPLDVSLQELDLGRHQVSSDPVSFHLTLQRCMSSFAFEAAYRHRNDSLTLHDLWHLDELPLSFFAFLVDHPLRTQVLCSQIETSRWVRNGAFAMSHQVSLYRNRLWHDMGAELDFFLMQCGAQVLGNAFILLALQRFELLMFFSIDREGDEESPTGYAAADYEMAADFLSLLVSIGRDRTRCGLSKEKALRREVVSWLAVSDLSYSQLVDKLSTWTSSKSEAVDAALSEVADFHEPQAEDDSGFYRLKQEEWCNVDQQFPRLSKMDRVKLEERLSEHPWPDCMKDLDTESLWPTFRFLPQRVFQSCVVHRMIFATCLKVLRSTDGDDISSLMPIFNYVLQACLYGILCQGRPTTEASETEIPADAIESSSLFTIPMVANDMMTNMMVPIDVGGGSTHTLLWIMFQLKSRDELPHGDTCITVDLVLDELYIRSEECAQQIDQLRSELVVPDAVIAQETALTPNRRREAQQRQAAIMAQFAQQQHAFMMELSSDSDEEDTDTAPGGAEGMPTEDDADDTAMVDTSSMECVLCRGQSESPIATVVTLQRSRLVHSCKTRVHALGVMENSATAVTCPLVGGVAETSCCPPVGGAAESSPPSVGGAPEAMLIAGDDDDSNETVRAETNNYLLHVQSCGHTVHLSCLRSYQRTMLAQELAHGAMIDNVMDYRSGEFACPVCRRLSNAALTITQPWCRGTAPLQPQDPEHEGLCEFFAYARSRKGMPGTTPLDEVAKSVLRDAVQLLDASLSTETAFSASGASPKDNGAWLAAGQRDCLAGIVRVVGRVAPPTITCVDVGQLDPPDITTELLPQFIGAILGWTSAHSSHSDFLALCEVYYCASVVQTVLALLPKLGHAMSLPLFRFVAEMIPLEELCTASPQGGYTHAGGSKMMEEHYDLATALENACMPILRQMAVLCHLRFDCSLTELPRIDEAETDQMARLITSLQVPSIGDMLNMTAAPRSVAAFRAVCSRHAGLTLTPHQMPALPRNAPAQFSLIELPEVYVTLLLQHQECQCALCGQVPKEPALCLVCGSLVCFKKADGTGECAKHAQQCCGDVGAFLVLRACAVVLLLGSGRQCVWGSLYLDAHGEKDAYLQRGKTLYLQPKKYRLLSRSLINHSILTDTTQISRTTRNTLGGGGAGGGGGGGGLPA